MPTDDKERDQLGQPTLKATQGRVDHDLLLRALQAPVHGHVVESQQRTQATARATLNSFLRGLMRGGR